jgi:hypothetical protein
LSIQNIKEEFNKYMENLRKKNGTEIWKSKLPLLKQRNTIEGHSSPLEQVEDRISELKNKIEIKEKNRINLSETT